MAQQASTPQVVGSSVLTHPDVVLRDLTGGQWPAHCQAISVVDGRPWSCTRRGGHTGRHAAGSHGRIAAVWAVNPGSQSAV